MEKPKKRVSVAGLRDADPTTLMVLTQDVLTTPLARLDPDTLCDLLALSQLESGLPVALAKDLDHFRPQMFRELSDLHDGPGLQEWAEVTATVAPERIPQSLRDAVVELVEERRAPEAVAALRALIARWEDVPPATFELKKPANAKKPADTAARTVVKAPKKRKAPKSSAAAAVDERRSEWIREDVVSRLKNYSTSGLKEPIVIAGARHRAPWKDVDEAEVRAVLRKLGREGRLRQSAGRWYIDG